MTKYHAFPVLFVFSFSPPHTDTLIQALEPLSLSPFPHSSWCSYFIFYFSHYSSNQALALVSPFFFHRELIIAHTVLKVFSFSFSPNSERHIHLFCRIKTRKKTARKKRKKKWSEKQNRERELEKTKIFS